MQARPKRDFDGCSTRKELQDDTVKKRSIRINSKSKCRTNLSKFQQILLRICATFFCIEKLVFQEVGMVRSGSKLQ